MKKYDSSTNRSIFLGVLDTVNADDMVRHLGLKFVPRTPIHVWLTTFKLMEEFTNNSNITFPLMLWRYKDTSSIIQRHIATVSNIDKASDPYISSMVSISNNTIWYETEKKFGDQKEWNLGIKKKEIWQTKIGFFILFNFINVTVIISRERKTVIFQVIHFIMYWTNRWSTTSPCHAGSFQNACNKLYIISSANNIWNDCSYNMALVGLGCEKVRPDLYLKENDKRLYCV